MGGREEAKDGSGTFHLLGSNNLGFFHISLNRGTAAKYLPNIFSQLPAAPERQKTTVAHSKGIDVGITALSLLLGLEFCLHSPPQFWG